MTADRSWSVDITVERGKILEFDRVFHATTADDARLAAPPTYPVVWNHWGTAGTEIIRDLGLDAGRILHGEEEYYYPNGPLREGQILHSRLELVDSEQKQGRRGGLMTLYRLQTDMTDASTGHLACRITRTWIERGGE